MYVSSENDEVFQIKTEATIERESMKSRKVLFSEKYCFTITNSRQFLKLQCPYLCITGTLLSPSIPSYSVGTLKAFFHGHCTIFCEK